MDKVIYIIGDLIEATPQMSVIYGLALVGGCWILSKTWKIIAGGGVLYLGIKLWIS